MKKRESKKQVAERKKAERLKRKKEREFAIAWVKERRKAIEELKITCPECGAEY